MYMLKNETTSLVPFIIFTPQIGSEFNITANRIIYNQALGCLPLKLLTQLKSPPVYAAQELFFEPVKDRWGICELL